MAEDKLSQRREHSRFFRAARNQKATAAASNIAEAIAQLGAAEDGRAPPTRMKIVVRKEDLKQVLEAIGAARRGSAAAAGLEQRLNVMRRRRQMLRAASQAKGRSRLGEWRPVLHSIPEEV